MKWAPSWRVAIGTAALGLAVFAAGRTGWLAYGHDRLKFGSTINLGGVCYRVPERWTLLEPTADSDILDLRRHFGHDSLHFASIHWGASVSQFTGRGVEVGSLGRDFKLFELPALPQENPIRHFALSRVRGLAVVGTSAEVVRELALRLDPC